MCARAPAKSPRRPGGPSPARAAAGSPVAVAPLAVPRPARWLTFAIGLFLAAAVGAVYAQTLNHEFINYDDDVYVYDNPAVAAGLSGAGVVWAFTHAHGGNWHPLTTLSHMLDCQFYGLRPGGHHLTNVLLHAATVLLLFLLLRRLTGALWRSAFVAAVFAVHPQHVESVAWVAERKDVLSGLFFVLTLWAYARYAQRSPSQRPNAGLWYGLALGLFALGLLSKPMLVTLPLVLLLLDFWPLQRLVKGNVWRLVFEKLPFLVLTVVGCVVTVGVQQEAVESLAVVDLSARLGNAVVAYVEYLGQLFYPAGLALLYLHPGQRPLWPVAGALLVLLTISVGVLVGHRRMPYLLVGWLWYLGMLVPVIGLLQVGLQARADRYTYLPEIGLYILLAWGAVAFWGNWPCRRAVLGSGAGAIIAGLLLAAHAQTAYWKNSVSLWSRTLACQPGHYLAHNYLGYESDQQGKLAEAVQHYGLALQLKPDDPLARVNLSKVLIEQEKWGEVIQTCQLALQLHPAPKVEGLAHNNLGYALSRQGWLDEAIQQYRLALQLTPASALAHINLGNALYRQGKWEEAIQHYEEELQLQPGDADAQNNLGLALVNWGRPAEALPHFQKALKLAVAQNHAALAEAIRVSLQAYSPPGPEPEKR